MKTYAVTNWKGGTGKTLTTVNLSDALSREGLEVLTADLDAQGDLSRWFDVYGANNGLYEALSGGVKLSDGIEGENHEGPAVIPSSDQMLTAAADMEDRTALRGELNQLNFDVCFLDCPPALNDVTVSALIAAEGVLIPTQCRVAAVGGLGRMMQVLEQVDADLTGVIANQVDRRAGHSLEVLETLQERFNGKLYDSTVRENIRLSECPSYKETIFSYAPSSRGAEDFRELANEFINREDLK